jgi:hypothetical protein
MRVRHRPSVASDFAALGETPGYRCHCLTALAGDAIVGLGGFVYRDGAVWASAIITPQARAYPAAIHRVGVAVMQFARDLGFSRIYALPQPDNEAAERWLTRLGFVQMGDLFVWER